MAILHWPFLGPVYKNLSDDSSTESEFLSYSNPFILKNRTKNMIYSVKARFQKERMSEFYQKLTDGTIEKQKPDGKEIIDSMKRAKITTDGEIMWSETCYCSPPLKHERETVYDNYLSDITTSPIEEYTEYDGESFMEYLEKLAKT